MTDDQLIGKYARLRAELDDAYAQPEWNTAQIDRITNELARLEHTLAARPDNVLGRLSASLAPSDGTAVQQF